MKLTDFEAFIEERIIDRGYDYYLAGAVDSLDAEDGEWYAEVCGTEMYEVVVTLAGDEIIASDCDCPYDYGEYCKHEVAVFYELRVLAEKGELTETRSTDLSIELNKLSKNELIELVLELSDEYRPVRHLLRREFDSNEKLDAKQIQNLIQLYLNFKDLPAVIDVCQKILNDLSKQTSTEQVVGYLAILEELMSLWSLHNSHVKALSSLVGEIHFLLREALESE